MSVPLDNLAKQGTLAEMERALTRASQVGIDRALVAAIQARRDAMVDLIFPRARPGYGISMALREAAISGYFHGLDKLLPFATIPAFDNILRTVLSKNPASALHLIARLPAEYDVSEMLPIAVSYSTAEVVQALLPLCCEAALAQALFSAATARPELIPPLAATVDVAPIVERLISSPDPRVLPGRSLEAVDALLPFVPPASALELVQLHPELHKYPAATVILQQAALECAIPEGRSPSSPRI